MKSVIFLLINMLVQFYLCYIIGWLYAKRTSGKKIHAILTNIKDGDDANELIHKLIDVQLDREDVPYAIKLADKIYDYVKSPKHNKQSK